MSKKKPIEIGAFLLFDVLYDDGTRTSNRKVPAAAIEDWDFDGSVRVAIEAQDREIAERSGRPRGAIVSITRSGTRAAERVAKRAEAGGRRPAAR